VFLLVRGSSATDGDAASLERALRVDGRVVLEKKKPMEEASGFDPGNGKIHNGLADGAKP